MAKSKHASIPYFKTGKSASIQERPDPKKVVPTAEPPWAKMNPAWRIQHLELCDPFGWHHLGHEMYAEILSKLAELESRTWAEILVQAKKQNHPVEVWKLEKPARDRLKEAGHDQVVELVSLRLTGKQRIWGIQDKAVLQLLWWDPGHRVCISELSNT